MNDNNVKSNETMINEDAVVIKVYYNRADNKESEWTVWGWALGFFA